MGDSPSMRYRATAKDSKGGLTGIVGKEEELFEELTAADEEQNDFVNRLREEIRDWRDTGYPATALVTRRCLEWFLHLLTGPISLCNGPCCDTRGIGSSWRSKRLAAG
jgi:hypothetical protein